MSRLGWAASGGIVALAVVLVVAATAGWAQTPVPTGGDSSSTCQQGQLCIQESPEPGSGGGGGQSLVGRDAPAHFARSLATMSVVALILGAFLLMALTGKRVPLPIRRKSARGRT